MKKTKKRILFFLFVASIFQVSAQLVVISDYDSEKQMLHIELFNESSYLMRFENESIRSDIKMNHIRIEKTTEEGKPHIVGEGSFFNDYYLFIKPNESFTVSIPVKEGLPFVVSYDFDFAKLNIIDVESMGLLEQRKYLVSFELFVYSEIFNQ